MGRVAIANVGLAGKAIMGGKWHKHSAVLVEQFKCMLNCEGVCGLCLCEVGSWDQPLTTEVRERVGEVLEEAFRLSSASEHGAHLVVWPQGQHPGETLTAWRGDMRVESWGQLNGMPRQPEYRVVERMLLLQSAEGGAAEHAILISPVRQRTGRFPTPSESPFAKMC